MKEIAIKEHHLYNKAYRNGESAVSKNVAVYVLRDYTAKKEMLRNPEKQYINRLGISVSKKLGCAVIRNRTKRVLRSAYAEAKKHGKMKTGFLIVLAGRFSTAKSNSKDVAGELTLLFEKLGMYITEGGES